MKILLLATTVSLPLANGLTPSGRWGHQAVYVPSEAAMYVIGGQVGSGSQITNDVLVMPLNLTNPTFNQGANDMLPPHAFASAAITPDSKNIVVLGGTTSSCQTDALAHTLNTDTGEWSHATPSRLIRRRGAGMIWVDNGSGKGAMMVVGGISDNLACAASTAAYTAADVLSLPMASSSLVSSRSIPSSLTGTSLAIADYAMASINGTTYMMGGQSTTGSLVSMADIGVWTKDKGWVSQKVAGVVPTGRVGASLVAHPTLDVLILYGGSISSGGKDTPTALVSLLNTTSWTWSSPANIQAPVSSASSYHSSIMTPSGVMITAFGLSTSGTGRSDVSYLDMRDPSGTTWAWTSTWSQDMLSSYSATSGSGVAAGPSDSAPPKSKIASILAPVLVVIFIGLPILLLYIRRRVRLAKKRRMARHFSFSSQEDSGDLQGVFSEKNRKTKTQYTFGRDANEKDGNVFSDITNGFKGILKKYSRSTSSSQASDLDFHDREMTQMSPGTTHLSQLPPKSVKWEEIDFGLGRLDERRVSTASAVSTTPTSPHALGSASSSDAHEFGSHGEIMNIPLLINFHDQHGACSVLGGTGAGMTTLTGSPMHDGQQPLIPIPSLVVMPPTNPNTPAFATQTDMAAYPAMVPSASYSPDPFADPAQAPGSQGGAMAQEALDWSVLAQDLEDRPAFRSISPTSTLRSHQHQSPSQVQPQVMVSSPIEYGTSPGRTASRPLPRPVSATAPNASRDPPPPFSSQFPLPPSGSPQTGRHVSCSVSYPSPSPRLFVSYSSPSSSPITRSASPNSHMRSSTPPQLPPLNLGYDPFQSSPTNPFGRTITLVNPKTGRRTSETVPRPPMLVVSSPSPSSSSSLSEISSTSLPYLSGTLPPRSSTPTPAIFASQPHLAHPGMAAARRGALPLTGFTSPSTAASRKGSYPYTAPFESSPILSEQDTPTPASVAAFRSEQRRSSTPGLVAPVNLAPGSGSAPSSSSRRGSFAGFGVTGTSGQNTPKSKLRVINPSDAETEE